MYTKKRIICLFDYLANTGYGTVSKNILPILKNNFGDKIHLDIVAINYFGKDAKGKDDLFFKEDENTHIYSAKLYDLKNRQNANSLDDFGRDVFLKLCQNNEYDGIFIMQDIGVVVAMMPTLKKVYQNRFSPKSIFYFPIDADYYPKQFYEGLSWFDVLATYTQWGKDVVLKSSPQLESKLLVIPHGINLTDFKKVETDVRSNFRLKYFGEKANDKIIFGNVNRNQPRKDIATTILAFDKAKKLMVLYKNKSNIFLYLHMNPNDPLGNDLYIVLSQTSLIEGEDYMFQKKGYELHNCKVEDLNLIYNGLDFFVTSALGGGWELTTYEAMACDKPVIAPTHTCFKHLNELGLIVEATNGVDGYEYIVNADNIVRPKIKVAELANTIYMCSNGLIETYCINPKPYLQTISWNKIGVVFCKLFKDVYRLH